MKQKSNSASDQIFDLNFGQNLAFDENGAEVGFEGYGSGSKQVLPLEPEIRSRAGTYFCFIFNRQPAAVSNPRVISFG